MIGEANYASPTMATVLTERIEKTPGICGGDARIAGTRIPVWLLVAYRHDGVTDERLLEFYPSLTLADLSAAWWYFAENRDEVVHTIKEQEEA
jgi:uncharacterized protein (DUF433 family)